MHMGAYAHPYTYTTALLLTWVPVEDLPAAVYGSLQLVLICITGLFLSTLMQRYKLISKPSMIPAMSFVLLCSFFPSTLQAFPEIWVGLLILLIVQKIFAAYNKQRCDMTYFDVALLSGIATLIYFPAIILCLFSILGMLRMRSTSAREFLIYLCGLLTVVWLTGTILFWFVTVDDFLASWQLQFHYFTDPATFFTTNMIIKLSVIGVAFIMALLLYFEKLSTNLIQLRRYMTVFVWLFLLLGAVLGLGIGVYEQAIYPLLIPVSMVIGYYFFHSKQPAYTESVHGALLLTTILLQYVTFV